MLHSPAEHFGTDPVLVLPNRFVVVEATVYDNSVVAVSPMKMDELGLFHGGNVLIKGMEGKDTVCMVVRGTSLTDAQICMNETVRHNLRVRIGDTVSVQDCAEVPDGECVRVRPLRCNDEPFTARLSLDTYLVPYFRDRYRPVRRGDCFLVGEGGIAANAGSQPVGFEVVGVVPGDYCFAAPGTVIQCEGVRPFTFRIG